MRTAASLDGDCPQAVAALVVFLFLETVNFTLGKLILE